MPKLSRSHYGLLEYKRIVFHVTAKRCDVLTYAERELATVAVIA